MPEPRDGEVLIKVHASGVNRPTFCSAKGITRCRRAASDIPGLEIAGEIVGGELPDSTRPQPVWTQARGPDLCVGAGSAATPSTRVRRCCNACLYRRV